MLDKLPASVRHLILIVGATFLGIIAKAVLDAQGVTGVHWGDALKLALNTAVVTGVTAFMVLYLTPITKQWGAFAPVVAPTLVPVPVIAPPSASDIALGVAPQAPPA